jgi:hypothetical protein
MHRQRIQLRRIDPRPFTGLGVIRLRLRDLGDRCGVEDERTGLFVHLRNVSTIHSPTRLAGAPRTTLTLS